MFLKKMDYHENTAASDANCSEINRRIKVLPEPVYYVYAPKDGTVLVALDVTIIKEENDYLITWWDTSYERRMRATKIVYNSDFFAFKRTESGRDEGLYFFMPMDLDIYESCVKRRLISGRDFFRVEDMIAAFQETTKDVW